MSKWWETTTVIKGSIYLVLMLVVLIPLIIYQTDNGHENITIEEFIGDKDLTSVNLTIEGNALFNQLCRTEEYDDYDKIKEVIYYIPLVDSNWTIDKEVRVILEIEPKKFSSEYGFEKSIDELDLWVDSMTQLTNNRNTFSGVHKIFSPDKIDNQTKHFFKNEYGIELAPFYQLSKITVDNKFSKGGMIFGICFVLTLSLIVFYPLKKVWMKNF